MQAFEYASPANLQETIKLLPAEWGHTQILAGGTDLISAMKDDVETPKRVVSLQHLHELKGVAFSPSAGLRLGAMASLDEVMENAHVKQNYPALITAADGVRSQQLRNMGTIGGDLLQRPRCWYYRAGYGLLAMREGKSLVPDGDNRYHAILGNSGPAYFVSPSSFAPILIALGAKAHLHGPGGQRTLPLEQLFVTPKSEGEREHSIKPNEVLTEITVPVHHGARMAVYEVRQKEAMDWPLAAAAVVLHMQGSTVDGARVVLGHVAPVPWPAPAAEAALKGKSIDESVATEAASAALNGATPLSQNAYKVQLAKVAVKRAIMQAVQGGA